MEKKNSNKEYDNIFIRKWKNIYDDVWKYYFRTRQQGNDDLPPHSSLLHGTQSFDTHCERLPSGIVGSCLHIVVEKNEPMHLRKYSFFILSQTK